MEIAILSSLQTYQGLFRAPSLSELGSSDSTTAAHPPWDAKGLCEHNKGMPISIQESTPKHNCHHVMELGEYKIPKAS